MAVCVYGSRPPASKSTSRAKSNNVAPDEAPKVPDASNDANSEGNHPNGPGSSVTEAANAPAPTQPAIQQPAEGIALSPEAHQVAGSAARLSHDESAVNGDLLNVSESHVPADVSNSPATVAPYIGQPYSNYQITGRRYSQVRSTRYDGPSPSQLSNHSALLHFTGTSDTSTSHAVESPTSRWLDLLIGDATLNSGALPEYDFEARGFDVFGNSVVNTPGLEGPQTTKTNGSQASNQLPPPRTRSVWLQERIPYPRYEQLIERQIWQTSGPIELQPQEHILFQHFVGHISQWVGHVFVSPQGNGPTNRRPDGFIRAQEAVWRLCPSSCSKLLLKSMPETLLKHV